MSKRLRLLSLLTVLALVVGAAPALADEGDEPEADGNSGKLMILLVDGFDTSEEELAPYAEMGFGWGELFKLNLYSAALGVSIDDLIADAEFDEESGEYEFAWGEIKKSLTEEQLAFLEAMPRNFGHLVSEAKRHHGRDEHRPAHAGPKLEKSNNGKRPNQTDS